MPSAAVHRRHDSDSLDLARLALLSSTSARVIRVAAARPDYSFSLGPLRALDSMRLFVSSLTKADANGHLDQVASGRAALADGRSLHGVGRLVEGKSSEPATAKDLRDLFGLSHVTVKGSTVDLGTTDVPKVSRALERLALAASRAVEESATDPSSTESELAFS